ncbi:uncharacterized protein LOC129899799 [Solanum dulcamara]|uniref:uncharacterized protein LOC129899799 n=1 Tax=Solanum dulcamara TaxID=45834 RepID=UPI00248679FC|nr:uncharacterized protein LOC129899799 [Solanum dulcamara]
MVNDAWLEVMPVSTLNHLASTGSDHCPLLLKCTERQSHAIKYFKFLHCWVDNENFLDTVRSCWERPVDGNPMRIFHQKLKRVSNTLSHWSRNQYGDIFSSVKQFEEQVIQAEENIINDNSEDNRAKLNQINAQYIRRRRRRLFIHQISDEQGNSIQGDDNIASAACTHFEKLFTAEEKHINEDVIKCILNIVTDQQNELLHSIPTKEELKEVVFSMSPTSAAGPDGMSGKFFWDIICDDLLKLVQHFFNGHCIPRYISHACLVLLPKIEHPNKLSKYRPISLSNFTSKIISKLLCLRLAPILPQLISDNQSGFVKGRSISENIMLAQEIIHNIKRPNIGDNVVIKLDMANAYDRVSWSFTCMVMRRMGFGEIFIDMVCWVMSNNWYSVIINGVRHGFFHSTRGLKQGDPLSPTLFIIGAEVLSRILNNLHQHYLYTRFHMERKGPQVNHLSFADDVIIFIATNNFSMNLNTKTLKAYETTSGQLINKDKSQFMLPLNTNPDVIERIGSITGFKCTHGPITYLGCPLYIGRQRIIYYTSMVSKVLSKIRGWSKKTLWGEFLKAKYCQRAHPVIKKWDTGQSIMWKHIMANKIDIEPHIHWHINSGTNSFWWDDWLGSGPLAYHNNHLPRLNNTRVSEYIENGEWNVQKIRKYAPSQLVQQILDTEIDYHPNTADQACWKLTSHGNFTSKSAWELVRKKRAKTLTDGCTWHTNIPFKLSLEFLHQHLNNITCIYHNTAATVTATDQQQQPISNSNRDQKQPATFNKYTMLHQNDSKLYKIAVDGDTLKHVKVGDISLGVDRNSIQRGIAIQLWIQQWAAWFVTLSAATKIQRGNRLDSLQVTALLEALVCLFACAGTLRSCNTKVEVTLGPRALQTHNQETNKIAVMDTEPQQ